MVNLLIPILIVGLIVYAKTRRVDPYQSFVQGAKASAPLILSIFPYLVAMFVAIELFRLSGLANLVGKVLAPVFNLLGIPIELSEFILIRPFSGNASIVMLKNIFAQYGVDSYISRCACVIMGGSDTVFYVVSIYFSGTSVKKTLLAIPIALLCSIVACVMSCWLCRIM